MYALSTQPGLEYKDRANWGCTAHKGRLLPTAISDSCLHLALKVDGMQHLAPYQQSPGIMCHRLSYAPSTLPGVPSAP